MHREVIFIWLIHNRSHTFSATVVASLKPEVHDVNQQSEDKSFFWNDSAVGKQLMSAISNAVLLSCKQRMPEVMEEANTQIKKMLFKK